MKKLVIAFPILLLATSIQAQTVGKKFQALASVKSNTTVNQMGTEMEIPSTGDITTDFEVKSLAGKTVTLTSTLKRIAGGMTMMGNEQKFDSNDSATLNNPQLAEALKELNKPGDITVEIGKAVLYKDMSGLQSGEDVATYLFSPVDAASAKEGFAWSDSVSSAEGSKIVNKYTVSKVTKDEVTLIVISDNKTITTKQQNGMDLKITMEGALNSTRIYDASNGLLKNATTTFSANGNTEVQGMTIPMTTKGSGTITIK